MTGLPSRIGPYPIEREVGRGGMGVVYLGRDPRLDRPVAIKLLPEAFAQDPERLARFEREARLLASLTHPNIAGIYGLEEHDRRRCLVLEYVEGETLAARLARGSLPLDEAVEVCRQIAAAVEAAHESGVIHRDLKPGNVMLTPAGAVKVLDFGLARGGAGTAAGASDLSASPTLAHAATEAGVILGTAAYMSPEQARGRPVDRRTDIWSFGCVLYECLAGRQAFAGETVSDMIALILQGEPDWKALPRDLPPQLRALLERCLTKDPKKRLRDIGEARLLLEGGIARPGPGAVGGREAAADRPRRAAWLPWAVAAVCASSAIVLGAMLAIRGRAREPVHRVLLAVPRTASPSAGDPACLGLSPDGTMLVAAVGDSAGGASLWLRPLDSVEGRALPGTDDANLPFWSPDGRYVAFSTQDKLKKLDLRGGSPEVLCPIASYGRGGSWSPLGTIVFSGGAEGPIYKVSQNGGTPEAATTLDSSETGHRFPRFLPDGRHFLFAAMPPREAQFTIYAGSIDSPRREKLMTADGTPVYVEPGYLLYGRNGRLVAHRFDASARRLIGEPIALVDEPDRTDWLGAPSAVAGRRGGFGYYRHAPVQCELVWMDAEGRTTGRVPAPVGAFESAYVSPDGTRALVIRRTSAVASDFWMVDLARGTTNRFTFGPGRVDRAVWSPDGSRVAFASDLGGRWDIYEKSAGGGPEKPIVTSGSLLKFPNAYTPDGRALVYEQIGERTGWDIWQASLGGDRAPEPLLATPYDEQFASLSSDGKWLAFSSNESGRPEIYVQDYPSASAKHPVSSTGGVFPQWRSDDRALAFLSGGNLALVEVSTQSGFRAGTPRLLPLRPDVVSGDAAPAFDRFIGIVRLGGAPESSDLTLVLNWRTDLARR